MDARHHAGRGAHSGLSDRDLLGRRHAGGRVGHDTRRLPHELLRRPRRDSAGDGRPVLHGGAPAGHHLRSDLRHRDGPHADAVREVPAVAGRVGAGADRGVGGDLFSAGGRRRALSHRLANRPLCRLFDADAVAGRLGRGAGRGISSAQPRLWLDPGGRGGRRARRAGGAAGRAGAVARRSVQGRAADGLLRAGRHRGRRGHHRVLWRRSPHERRAERALRTDGLSAACPAAGDAAADVRRSVLHAGAGDHRAALSVLLPAGARLHAAADLGSSLYLRLRRADRAGGVVAGCAPLRQASDHPHLQRVLRDRAVDACWRCPRRICSKCRSRCSRSASSPAPSPSWCAR